MEHGSEGGATLCDSYTAQPNLAAPPADAPEIWRSAASPLRIIATLRGRPIDIVAAERALAGARLPHSPVDVARAIRRVGLRGEVRRVTRDLLAETPLPVLARHTSGEWFVILRAAENGVVVCSGDAGRHRMLAWDALEACWTGVVIVAGRRTESDTPSIVSGFSWLLPTLARYRGLFGQVLIASILIQCAALVTPLLNQVVIDRVFSQGVRSTLEVMAIGLLLAAVFEAVLTACRAYLFSHTAARIDVELGARLFDHLLKLPATYFEVRRTGHTVAQIGELNRVRDFVTSSSLMIVVDLAFCTIFFAIMMLYSASLTALVAVSVVLYLLLFSCVTALMRSRLDEQFRRGAESQAFMTEAVSTASTVKALALEPQMQRGWEDRLAAQARAGFEVKRAAQWGPIGADLIMRLTQAAVLFVGAGEVIAGNMTVGAYIAFSMFSMRATQPVLRLAQVWSDFQQFRVSLRRLGELAMTPIEPGLEQTRSVLPRLRGSITFDRVSFRYPGATADVLSNLSFDIRQGELVALQGPSGSGKTTVLKLILRELAPTSGRILIDGVDIAEVDPLWLRRQIGWIAQEPVLFTRTIRENIAITRPETEIERVIEVARLADAHEFIIRMPKGYDTQLEERGANLSGGQRQRLTIARALLGKPALLLIDEPTSALDGISRNRFIARLPTIVRGLSGILVSHDQKVLAACHRTIILGT